jgi:hypothetical protein
MSEQSMFDDDGFAAYCSDKENWSKDRVLREAHKWYQQAELINRVLQQLMNQNVTLAVTNDHLIELLGKLNALHEIAPQVLAKYKSQRTDNLREGEIIIRQGMEKNASLAATAAFSERQSRAGSGPRNRTDLVRDQTIKAMRRWRRRAGVTLNEFIADRANSDTGIRISNPTPNNGDRYTIDCHDNLGNNVKSKRVPLDTLAGWWTLAGKSPKPKPPKR